MGYAMVLAPSGEIYSGSLHFCVSFWFWEAGTLPATLLMNFTLCFSCCHTLAVSLVLLPAQLQPGWGARIGLFLAGLFFLAVALLSTVTTLQQKGII